MLCNKVACMEDDAKNVSVSIRTSFSKHRVKKKRQNEKMGVSFGGVGFELRATGVLSNIKESIFNEFQ